MFTRFISFNERYSKKEDESIWRNNYEYLKRIKYDGRIIPGDYTKDPFEYLGYHYYMTPEDAARGILLMDEMPGDWPDSGTHLNYTDVSKGRIFK